MDVQPRVSTTPRSLSNQNAGTKRLPTAGWRLQKHHDEVDADCAAPPSLLRNQQTEDKDHEEKIPRSVQYAVGLLIVINAGFLGACTNAREDDRDLNTMCDHSEHVFTALFLLEFLVKLYLLRVSYFYSTWNWLDCALLIFSILDVWVLTPVMGGTGPQSQMGKGMVLRLFRLVRVLRLFKLLKQRQELLILIEGLAAAFSSMVWVGILLVIVIYGAALFCVSIFRDVQTNCPLDFSEVPVAMLTMFTVGTLADWTEIVMPVVQDYVWAGPFFILFALLVNFAMLNLVIGVITERTTSVKEKYIADQSYHYDMSRLKVVESLAAIIFEEGQRTFITSEELYDIIHHHEAGEKIQDLIMEVDLPIGFTVQDFHGMLDRVGRGRVNREEFIQGMASIMFCSEFQQNCLIQAAVASLRMHIKVMLDDVVDQVRADIVACSLGQAYQQPLASLPLATVSGNGAAASLPPAAFGGHGAPAETGRAQLQAAEALVKAAAADAGRPWPPDASTGELEKLVEEIVGGCTSWSSLALGVLDIAHSASPAMPPLPHFGAPSKRAPEPKGDADVAPPKPEPRARGIPAKADAPVQLLQGSLWRTDSGAGSTVAC